MTTAPSNIFRNAVALLKGALHPGAHALYVAQIIDALEQMAQAEEAAEAATPAEAPAFVEPVIVPVPVAEAKQ